MIKKHETIRKIVDKGIVAVLRSETEEKAMKVANACLKGGVNIIEITFSVPHADKVISALKDKLKGIDVVLGAGTVVDAITARIAILAGAEFIVAPTFDKDVAIICNIYGIPYMPGCMTVNEMKEAIKYGVDIIKLFPADQFSSKYIKNIKAPLPQVNIMVTGGVNVKNTQEWIRNGAVAVGVGGNLTTVINDDYDSIEKVAAEYIEQVKLGRE